MSGIRKWVLGQTLSRMITAVMRPNGGQDYHLELEDGDVECCPAGLHGGYVPAEGDMLVINALGARAILTTRTVINCSSATKIRDAFGTYDPCPAQDTTTKARDKTPTEVAAASAENMNHLLSTMDAQKWAAEFCALNKASDHGTMLSWFACALMAGFDEANRRRDKEEAKLQNVIKSLTAQNAKKQEQISQYRKGTDKGVANLQNLIDIQATPGNWDCDEYMRGMLNGMLCAMSCFNGSETTPPYKEALPERRKEANKCKAFNVIRGVEDKFKPGHTTAAIVDALAAAKLI